MKVKRKLIILGPSDKTKPMRFGNILNYDSWIDELAVLSRKYFQEVIFIPDAGVYVDFAIKFKDLGGKITAIIPDESEPSIKNALRYTKKWKKIEKGWGWSFLNTHIVGESDYSLCLGFSAGSILEVLSAKYINKYENRDLTIFIDRRSVSEPLHKEIHHEIRNIHYFNSSSELEKLFSDLLPIK